jgi:cbb3-type cytochrome oxidase cytochrome c subunit
MGEVYKAFFILICLFIFVGSADTGADEVKELGRKIFIEKRCYTCHTINAESKEIEKEKERFAKEKGIETSSDDEEEDRIGVDLSDIGNKRDKDSLTKFLKNPKPFFKDSPPCKRNAKKKYRKRFKGTPEDFDSLIAYLITLKYESQQEKDFESCLKEQ